MKAVFLTAILLVANSAHAASCEAILSNPGSDLLALKVDEAWARPAGSREGLIFPPGAFDVGNQISATLKMGDRTIPLLVYEAPNGRLFALTNEGPSDTHLLPLSLVVDEFRPVPKILAGAIVQFADGRTMDMDMTYTVHDYPDFEQKVSSILRQNTEFESRLREIDQKQREKFRRAHGFELSESSSSLQKLEALIRRGIARPADINQENIRIYRFDKTGESFVAVRLKHGTYFEVQFLDLSATLSGNQTQRGALVSIFPASSVDQVQFGTEITDVLANKKLSIADLLGQSFADAELARLQREGLR